MPIPVIYPIAAAALGVIGLLRLRAVTAEKKKLASAQAPPAQTQEQIQRTIEQAVAAGGVHSALGKPGDVIFSVRDQRAMAKPVPTVFAPLLSGPGEPPSQATINMLKIAIDAGQGPNPATTLKTTKGGSLFDIRVLPLNGGQSAESMDGVTPGDLLSVDITAAGIAGPPGSTVFLVRALPDLASKTILGENVDPRVPPGLVMAVPFAAINGVEIH